MSRPNAHSNAAAFKRGQFRFDNAAPTDGPLTECADCGGSGCECCNGKGYFYGDQPMSATEYERMKEDHFASMYEDRT